MIRARISSDDIAVYTVRSMSIAMRLNEGRVKVHDVTTGEVDDGRSPTRTLWSIARAVAVNPHRDVTPLPQM
jgi:hypothetical protein